MCYQLYKYNRDELGYNLIKGLNIFCVVIEEYHYNRGVKYYD